MWVSLKVREDSQINYKSLEETLLFAARSSMKTHWMNFVFLTNPSIKNMIRTLVASNGWFRIKRRLTNSRMRVRVLLILVYTKRKLPKIMLNKKSYSIRQQMMTLKLHHSSREEELRMLKWMFLIIWKTLSDKKVILMLVKAQMNILVSLILVNKLQKWNVKSNRAKRNNKKKQLSR
jgi:hypothetical protein